LYCLLRVNDKIDESVTTKFVFIHWMGNAVPFFQKGKITLHISPVKEFIGQSHISHQCNTLDEITDEIVMEKVMDFSGSGSRVLDQDGKTNLKTQRTQKISNVQTKRTTTDEELDVDQEVLEAIAGVRNDVNSLTWCMAGYENSDSNKIILINKGQGNVEDLKTHLLEDIVAYGLVRKTEKIDNSVTVKFCYFRWVGPNIPRMQRAKLMVHTNPIQRTFSPYHVDVQCERLDEITDAIVEDLIAKASGTKVHVLEDGGGERQSLYRGNQTSELNISTTNQNTQTNPQPERKITIKTSKPRTVSVGKTQTSQGVLLKDEESVRAFIKSVRDDSDSTDWCLLTYDAPKSNTLVTLAKGSGGISELVTHLTEDIVAYGLLRKSDKVDLSETVKFCFIDWRGTNINYMQRAQLGTHSGFVTELFHPYHVDIQTNDLSELSEENIIDKIKHAAGTKNYVLT